jgi:hypothetical protein
MVGPATFEGLRNEQRNRVRFCEKSERLVRVRRSFAPGHFRRAARTEE